MLSIWGLCCKFSRIMNCMLSLANVSFGWDMLLSLAILFLVKVFKLILKRLRWLRIVLYLCPHQIRSFLSLNSYLWRFVKWLSSIVSSLTTMTQKKVKFLWLKVVGRVSKSWRIDSLKSYLNITINIKWFYSLLWWCTNWSWLCFDTT